MSLYRRLITSLSKSGSAKLRGDVTLSEGANITLTQSGNDISIASTGGGGGSSSIGGAVTGGTQYSILFIDPAGTLAQDNTNLNYNNSLDSFSVGQVASQIKVNSASITPRISTDLQASSLFGYSALMHNATATESATIALGRSRGTFASPTIVQTSDTISSIASYGYTGNATVGYQKISEIVSSVDSTGTISTTSMPGKMELKLTPNGSVTPSTVASYYFQSGIPVQEISGVTKIAGFNATAGTALISNPPYSLVIDNAGTNLIPNPSFENNVTDSWSILGTNVTRTRVTTNPYVGSACCQVSVSPATAAAGIETTTITLPSPNPTKYVVSAWIKGNVGGELVRIGLTGNSSGLNFTTQTLTSNWKRYYYEKIPSALDTTFKAVISTDTASAITFFVDGVQLEIQTSSYPGPSTYMDGSLTIPALGYAWTGTAHNSSSTRDPGLHTISPFNATTNSAFAISPDGTFGAMRYIFNFEGGQDSSGFLFDVTADMPTNSNFGVDGSLMRAYNTNNGVALQVKSNATTENVMVVSGPNVTTGSVFAVAAPESIANFTGSYLRFLDKSNKDMFVVKRDRMTYGNVSFAYPKIFNFVGSGGISEPSVAGGTTAQSGTITITNGLNTVSGSGTTFNSLSPGDVIKADNNTNVVVVQSVTNNGLLTLIDNATFNGSGNWSKVNTQYGCSKINMSGPASYQKIVGFSDPPLTVFPTRSDLLRVLPSGFYVGTSTLVLTSGSNVITVTSPPTSGTNGYSLSPGDWIHIPGQTARAAGHPPLQILKLGTSGTNNWKMSGPALASFTTASAGWYVQKGSNSTGDLNPTGYATLTYSDDAGISLHSTVYTEATNAGPGGQTAEVSLFNTNPIIRAYTLTTNRPIRVTIYGTLVGANAAKTLTLKVKLGTTTVLTSHAEVIADTATNNFVMNVIIAPDASETAQKTILDFNCKSAVSNSATDPIITYATSSVDMRADQALDITAQFSTASTMNAQYKIVEVL